MSGAQHDGLPKAQQAVLANSSAAVTPSNATPSSRARDAIPDPAFEGDSSLRAHSRFANDLVERKLQAGRFHPDVDETLAALKQLRGALKPTQTEHDTWFDNAIPAFPPSAKPELPPFATVAALLRAERGIYRRQRPDNQWLTIVQRNSIRHC